VGERTGEPRHNSECNHRGHPRRSRRANRSTASGESWLPWAVITTPPKKNWSKSRRGAQGRNAAQHPETHSRPARTHTSPHRGSSVGSRRALFRFGLPAAHHFFLALGALVRFGSPAACRFFPWLAALSLNLACLRRFLPWIGVLSFLARGALVSVCRFFVARGVCVCVFAPSLSRVLLLTSHALFSPCSAVALVSRRKERV
jgi:hypothetical protein